ncbi:DUF885 domain-containing protein [Elongatibacter sediminis]|uniref:DUF885 domain-containing protein n=1 Tax=Elongatibacter sediminis TaxID=3119006 RepID=A0AAW9RFD6_9GAMM
MRSILMAVRGLTTALAIVLLAAACKPSDSPVQPESQAAPAPQAAASAPDEAPAPAWNAFVDDFIEAFLVAHPAWAVVQGRHEFDGQLPDWSQDGIAAEIARLKTLRDQARSFASADLGPEGEYQRDYLLATVDRILFWMDKAEWPYANPAFYFDWQLDSLDPSPYIALDYAPLAERMQAFTRYAENIPRAVAQIRENLRMPMPRTRLEYGIASFGGMATYLRDDVPGVFAGAGDESAQARFSEANAAAADALTELTDWLISNRESATEDYALGADLFRQMLYDTERVDISLADLEAMGREDMRRNQRALGEACAEFAPGESIQACFARMANRKPPGGAVETAREQVEEIRAFLVEQDLVTIPGPEKALVAESPPYARSNSAYINIPGPFEKNQPSVYYISPPDPSWPEEVQQAYIPGESDLLFTSVHEVWPGHFLNFLHANRAEWIFGRLFVTYAFGEGWAHYTEEMMLEAGLRDASAETRIGQISNALLRNARFLSAIGLHTQGMSVAESERLFMEEAYQDEGTARQQAARGTYDPAYLNYNLGKLMIRQLREDWTEGRGGRDAWREFHDTFLSFGGPPIPLVRARMLGGKAGHVDGD